MAPLGWNDLKKRITITPATVQCPVLCCGEFVERQRTKFLTETRSICPVHRICISPSTFEYANERDNMLWTSEHDIHLWNCIKAKGVKRESRMARDNSEDALTWNVFRYLETHGLIGEFIDKMASEALSQNSRVIYWSYCQASRKPLTSLVSAAGTFGERISRRSEPDLILEDDNVLVFVECKLGAGNRTKPSDPDDPKLYAIGGNSWFTKIFHPDASFTKIAVEDRLYELMRLWILGSWMASQEGKRFILVNVVREGAASEADIEARFIAHTQNDIQRTFVRCTWERIYSDFVAPRVGDRKADRVAKYMKEKTLGYSSVSNGTQGKLRPAFLLPR